MLKDRRTPTRTLGEETFWRYDVTTMASSGLVTSW